MFAWPIHFVAFDGCWWIWENVSILSGSHTGENVLALQVKMWKRGKLFEDEVFIENSCLEVGSKKRRAKFKCERSFKTWSRGYPGQWFPETDCLCASAIFASGTSGILPILNYRRVSPMLTALQRCSRRILQARLTWLFRIFVVLNKTLLQIQSSKQLLFCTRKIYRYISIVTVVVHQSF